MAAPTQCYLFDGTGDLITLIDDAAWDVTSAVSVGCWVMRDYDDLDTHSHLMHRATTLSLEIDDDNRVLWSIYAATPLVTKSFLTIPAEKPVFIAAVAYESGTSLVTQIWIDGKLDKTETFLAAALPAAAATVFYMGCDATPTANFKGTMSSWFMTSDQVTAAEIAAIYAATPGQATGLVDNLLIDIDCEGDLVNAGTGPNGTATNAVLRTYMNIWQSMGKNYGTVVIPEAETGYSTHKPVKLKWIHWEGENIADGDDLQLGDYSGASKFHHHAVAADEGGTWAFDDEVWRGFQVLLLDHGKLEIQFA